MEENLSTEGSGEEFTRLNIPVWIRIFGGCIAVVLLFSLFTLPRSIYLSIHLERGKKAIKEKKFYTAEKELSKVLEKAPASDEAQGGLLIAAFYNQDFETFNAQWVKLRNTDIGADRSLSADVDKVMSRAVQYNASDTFENFTKDYPDEAQIPDPAWYSYLEKHKRDRFAMLEYANLLLDRKEYGRCDSLLELTLQSDDEYIPALMLEVSARTEQGDPEGAMPYIERILEINHESIWGLSAKARTLLRQKKFRPGLEAALKLYDLDNKNYYGVSTLMLAYHFNGHTAERDALIKKVKSDALDSTGRANVQYALDVIDNKEKF
jgi:hypothetical protein